MTAQRFVLARYFDGIPKESDFRLDDFVIPQVRDGEFMYEAMYHSVDPYMGIYHKINSDALKEGDVMVNFCVVAKVTASRNNRFPMGSLVRGPFGWVTHGVSSGHGVEDLDPILDDLRPSLACGALGIPGLTAYIGVVKILRARPGDTIYVNSAAGTVGSLAVQIARLKGCRVIASAGSEDKVNFLRQLGVKDVFNYKTTTVDQALSVMCPKGLDCFFDNVGGKSFYTVLQHMNEFGRVAICGLLSQYFTKFRDQCVVPTDLILMKQLRIEGFVTARGRFDDHAKDFYKAMAEWIKDGRIIIKEDVKDGFHNLPRVLGELLKGQKIGKAVIRI